MDIKSSRYATFAWVTLGINILVIIWGAFVRATGSGAGCGSNWPLCHGEVIPQSAGVETMIEFSHRISSGVALIAVAILFIWAWRIYPRGYRTRRAANATMIFMIIEALIGAGLVLLEYTASNVSIARAYWMAGHLINTFLLLGARHAHGLVGLGSTFYACTTSRGRRLALAPIDHWHDGIGRQWSRDCTGRHARPHRRNLARRIAHCGDPG